MALVKKLQIGGNAPVKTTQKDYSQIEKALYDDLYAMPAKEARRAKPAYDKVAALVRSGAMDKAVKFNPDRTYSIDTTQLPEDLKKFNWGGHEEPLTKDLLGFGRTVGGEDTEKEALSSAMSALRTYSEATPTTSTTPGMSTGYEKELPKLGDYVIKKHYGAVEENFAKDFGKIGTDEERKKKALTWAKENVDEYLADYDKNKDAYKYGDIENVKELKSTLSNPKANWEQVSEKAYKLGWNMGDFLLSDEEKTYNKQKQIADVAAATVAENARVSKLPRRIVKTKNIYTTTTRFVPKVKPRAANLLSDMSGTEGSILALNAASLVPGVVGLSASAGATGLETIRDVGEWQEGKKSGLAVAGNLALNLGLTAAAAFGGGFLRGAVKGEQLGARALKIADKAMDIEKGVLAGEKATSKFMGTAVQKEVQNSVSLLNKFAKDNKIGNNLAAISKVAAASKDEKIIAEVAKLTALSERLGKSTKILPHISNLTQIIQRTGQAAALGNAAMNLGGASTAVGKITSGDLKNLTTDDINSLTSVAFGARIGTRSGLKKLGKKYGTVSTTNTPESLNVNIKGETKTITDKDIIDKLEKIRLNPLQTKNKAAKEAIVTKLNAGKPDAEKITIKDIDKITHTKATESGFKLREDLDIDKSRMLQKVGKWSARRYNLAPAGPTIEKQAEKVAKETQKAVSGKVYAKSKTATESEQEILKRKAKSKNLKNLLKIKKFTNPREKARIAKKIIQLSPEKKLKGGILKYAAGNTLYGGNRVDLSIKAKNPANLNYGKIDVSGNDWRFGKEGKYTPEYKSTIAGLTPEWFSNNQEKIQGAITASGSKYKLSSLDQLKHGATDYRPGVLHDIFLNKPMAAPSTGVTVGPGATPGLPTIPATIPGVTSTGTTYKPETKSFKVPAIDKVDLMNTGLYLNTLAANRGKVSKDIQAYLNVPLKTLLPNQQIVQYNPYGQMAKETEVSANRMGARQGVTSDANKNAAIRAEMWSKGQAAAGDLRAKGAQTTSGYLQKQQDADYRTHVANVGIHDQNIAAIRAGQSKALMTEGMLPVAQNAALNNLLLSYQKNEPEKMRRQYQTGMFDILQNPKYKTATEEYAKSLEEESPYKKNWAAQMKVPGVKQVDFNESEDYNRWQEAIKAKEKAVVPFNERLKNIQMMMMYQQPYSAKKGGSLLRKIEADKKMFYKIINANNKLVTNDSIDLSKSEKNALSSDKTFYKAILKSNTLMNKALSKLKK